MLLTAAWNAAAAAEVWVILLDADKYVRKPDLLETEADPLRQGSASFAGPLLVALNKVDAVGDKARLLPLMQRVSRIWPRAEILPVSATRGQGLPEFLARVLDLLPEGPPAYPEDQLSTAPLRFMPRRWCGRSSSWPCARRCPTGWRSRSRPGRRSPASCASGP
jgi:GTP-binding protein Era